MSGLAIAAVIAWLAFMGWFLAMAVAAKRADRRAARLEHPTHTDDSEGGGVA